MSTTVNFNLRGVDSRVMSTLKQEAEKQHISINFLSLKKTQPILKKLTRIFGHEAFTDRHKCLYGV